MFKVYKQYPFPVSFRTKFFNVFRFLFTNPVLENFLVKKLQPSHFKWWSKFIPPLYFYNSGSIRVVQRNRINYKLDISKLLDHSIHFHRVHDLGWNSLFRLLRPNFHVVDVGANIGFLTLNFAKLCYEGYVYSFEPDTESFTSLQQNVNQNNFRNVRLFHVALGSEAGEAELYKLYANNPGANRILKKRPDESVKSETVRVETLNSYYDNKIFKRVDLIKIDVEGYELFVLQGATEVINRWKPILFVELADVNLRDQNCMAFEIVKFIEDLGYSILDAHKMEPLDFSVKEFYTDIICFPKDGIS